MPELPRELPNNLGLYEIRKFQENPQNAWIWWQVPSRLSQAKIWRFSVKIAKKSDVKHSIENPILLNFVNLFPIFRVKLSDEANFDF